MQILTSIPHDEVDEDEADQLALRITWLLWISWQLDQCCSNIDSYSFKLVTSLPLLLEYHQIKLKV